MIANRDVSLRDELTAITPSMRSFARALVEDHATDTADELVQEALLGVLNGQQNSRGLRLRMVVISAILLAHRRILQHAKSKEQANLSKTAPQGAPARDASLPAKLRTTKGEMSALGSMPIEWREPFLLVALESLSYTQVAECMGVTLNTVVTNLAHAREHLARTGSTPRVAPASAAPNGRAVPYLRLVK